MESCPKGPIEMQVASLMRKLYRCQKRGVLSMAHAHILVHDCSTGLERVISSIRTFTDSFVAVMTLRTLAVFGVLRIVCLFAQNKRERVRSAVRLKKR